MTKPNKFLKSLGIIFILFSISFTQNTGKIRGKIFDENSSALHGAQIFIKNTGMGAVTDEDGVFILIGIYPGEYDVQIDYIGYKSVLLKNVEVSVNRTTEINLNMEVQAVEFQTIEITQYKHARKKDQTGSIKNINGKFIDELPVTDVQEILETQAGIVQGHFRGGRNTDVSYLIDGIPINNNFSGDDQLIGIPTEIIKDIEVITGTFNAEYGKAMSGIVNTITKSGKQKFGLDMKVGTHSYFTNQNDYFIGLDNPQFKDNNRFSFNIKGPILNNILSGILNIQTNNYNRHLFGINRFIPSDYSDFNHSEIAPVNSPWNVNIGENVYYSESTGDNSFVPMDWINSQKLFSKISFHPYQNWNIQFSTNYENIEFQNYDHVFKYKPIGRAINYQSRLMNSFQFSHLVNPKLTYVFTVSQLASIEKSYLFESPLDENYISDRYLSYVGGFITGGMDKTHNEQQLQNKSIKWNLIYQINNIHGIKIGTDYFSHEIKNSPKNIVMIDENDPDLFLFPYDTTYHEFTFGIVEMEFLPDSLDFSDKYEKYPIEFSAFIQDKMEYDKMVINLGLRYDYFNPNTIYPTQMRNPGNQLFFPVFDDDGNPILDENDEVIPDSSRMSSYINAKSQIQISPRFGLSYSIEDYAVIHFSYGHFIQMPPFYALYQNYRFQIPVGDYQTILGNPNLNAEKTVQYELGYWQQFNNQINGEIIVYYRDIYDLLSTEVIITYNNIKYGYYTNKDYGNVKGLELTLNYLKGNFNISGNYTLQYTRGNADKPTTSFYRESTGEQALPKLIPMSWDQRHTFNLIFNYSKNKLSTNFVAQYNSGLPYTMEPLAESPLSNQFIYPNNAHGPSSLKVNAKISYSHEILESKYKFSIIINNLHDVLIEKEVYSTTGRATSYHIPESTLNSFVSNYNGIHDMYKNPSMFEAPREIKFSIEWQF